MLLNIKEYCSLHHISERTFYRFKENQKVKTIGDYVLNSDEFFKLSESDKKVIIESRTREWNSKLLNAHHIYTKDNKPTKETTKTVQQISTEFEFLKKAGYKIKGFNKRCCQIKIKKGTIQRKHREEKPIRNDYLSRNFNKAIELIFNLNSQRAISSVNEAIDRAIYYSRQHEEHYEVAALEKHIHSLRRHVYKAIKSSGFNTLHEYLNHYNIFRKKLAYAKADAEKGFADVKAEVEKAKAEVEKKMAHAKADLDKARADAKAEERTKQSQK